MEKCQCQRQGGAGAVVSTSLHPFCPATVILAYRGASSIMAKIALAIAVVGFALVRTAT